MLREAALRLSGRWRSKIWTILILASTGLRQNTDGRLVNCPRAVVKSRCGTNPTAHREANEAGNEVFLQKVLASTRSASVRWLSVSQPTDAKLPAFVLPVHQPHGERRCTSPDPQSGSGVGGGRRPAAGSAGATETLGMRSPTRFCIRTSDTHAVPAISPQAFQSPARSTTWIGLLSWLATVDLRNGRVPLVGTHKEPILHNHSGEPLVHRPSYFA